MSTADDQFETAPSGSKFAQRLLQAKLDAMKELAYGASHEINNPLANISARAQALLREETDPERRRALNAINEQALRAHEMISDLMLFARPPELVLEKVQIAEVIEQAVAEMRLLSEERHVSVQFGALSKIAIEADRSQLIVAVGTLLRNAVEAIGNGGVVTITAERQEERISITIADNGPGVPADVKEHQFDPFYSGREAGRGHGFGLSKCWRIVTEHGGEIKVDSPESDGATFTIVLPMVVIRSSVSNL